MYNTYVSYTRCPGSTVYFFSADSSADSLANFELIENLTGRRSFHNFLISINQTWIFLLKLYLTYNYNYNWLSKSSLSLAVHNSKPYQYFPKGIFDIKSNDGEKYSLYLGHSIYMYERTRAVLPMILCQSRINCITDWHNANASNAYQRQRRVYCSVAPLLAISI